MGLQPLPFKLFIAEDNNNFKFYESSKDDIFSYIWSKENNKSICYWYPFFNMSSPNYYDSYSIGEYNNTEDVIKAVHKHYRELKKQNIWNDKDVDKGIEQTEKNAPY